MSVEQALHSVRYDLRVDAGIFAGSGAGVLANAVHESHYVLIGEDHFTREIPKFTAALCGLAAPDGLAGLAMEVSPEAAAFVASHAKEANHWSQMVTLTGKYPSSVAFVDSREENDLVTKCAQLSGNPSFHVWGLDQAFLGSAEWMIDLMLSAHPGPSSKVQLQELRKAAANDAQTARSTGDFASLFLLAPSTGQQLSMAAPAVERDGGPAVEHLFQELRTSYEIYTEQAKGGDGNFKRARLLKENFLRDMRSLAPEQANKKVIVKFGEWHLYKGFNPLHHLDLGNFIAEEADVHDDGSLHICILGAHGVHRAYGRYAQPSITRIFSSVEDPFYRWMAPAIADQLPNGWTLYDLRKLRFRKFTDLEPDLARVIDGYDLLIIVPDLSPADLAH